jgi:hypothetical protein
MAVTLRHKPFHTLIKGFTGRTAEYSLSRGVDLVDALSSNTTARTAVELALNPHFRRHYTALNKAVV